jgi:hypothetical protein
MATKEDQFKLFKDKINDYEQTVNAILSFAAFIVHDGESSRPGSEFGIGRRMTTSCDNHISPNAEITPDLIAQKSEEYGIVAEVKKGLDRNDSNWISHVKQLRKYDDELEGWWTKNQKISHSDSVMLIHQSRSRPFSRFLSKQKELDLDSVGGNTCIVDFIHSGERIAYYFFRLEFGTITDKELGRRLEDGVNIPLDEVRMSFPNIQYYDVKPPMPLLLSRLWSDVFPSMLEYGDYDEKTRSTKIQVSVPIVTDELQKAFGSKALKQDQRSGEFPNQKWIRGAFNQLVRYKLASPLLEEVGNYLIHFRPFREDVLDHFINLEQKKKTVKNHKTDENQMTILPDLDEEADFD